MEEKLLGKRAEEEEARAGSWIQGCREEDDQWEVDRWVLVEQLGA